MAGGGSRELDILGTLLTPGELVKVHIVEKRLGGARMLEPANVFATDRRIIIIRRGVLGFHQDFKIIDYSNITEIVLKNGIRYSKLHFALKGEVADPTGKRWLVGLDYKEALGLVRFVNGMVEKPTQQVATGHWHA